MRDENPFLKGLQRTCAEIIHFPKLWNVYVLFIKNIYSEYSIKNKSKFYVRVQKVNKTNMLTCVRVTVALLKIKSN